MTRVQSGKRMLPLAALVVLLAWAFASQGLAMDRGDSGGRSREVSPEQVVAHLSERLQLNAGQEEAIHPIIAESIEEKHQLLQEFRSRGTRDRGALQEVLQGQQREVEKRLAGVLTPEQQEEHRKLVQQQGEQRRGRRGGGF